MSIKQPCKSAGTSSACLLKAAAWFNQYPLTGELLVLAVVAGMFIVGGGR